ncbi:unnamed protein product, partial [Sphagnum tenellum]
VNNRGRKHSSMERQELSHEIEPPKSILNVLQNVSSMVTSVGHAAGARGQQVPPPPASSAGCGSSSTASADSVFSSDVGTEEQHRLTKKHSIAAVGKEDRHRRQHPVSADQARLGPSPVRQLRVHRDRRTQRAASPKHQFGLDGAFVARPEPHLCPRLLEALRRDGGRLSGVDRRELPGPGLRGDAHGPSRAGRQERLCGERLRALPINGHAVRDQNMHYNVQLSLQVALKHAPSRAAFLASLGLPSGAEAAIDEGKFFQARVVRN